MSLPTIYAGFDSSTTSRLLLLPFTSSPSSSSSCRRGVLGPHLSMRRWRPRPSRAPVRAAAGEPPVPAQENKDGVRMASDIQTLLRRFWKVAAPYWSSEENVQARLRLGSVFALTLATTGISVGFDFLGGDFYNALARCSTDFNFLQQRSRTIFETASVLPGGICCRHSSEHIAAFFFLP